MTSRAGAAARPEPRRALGLAGFARREARALSGCLAPQGGAHRHAQLSERRRCRGRHGKSGARGGHLRRAASSRRRQIRKSSGIPELDQAALEILKLASPFDPFPAELAQEYRLLRFAYEWQFVGGRVERGNRAEPSLRPPPGMPILEPAMSESTLTNHLLIAMPSLADPNFAQTVTLICEHSDKGALGIVLNKPLPMKLSDVLTQMKLAPSSEQIAAQPVLRGGPVHTDRGFVLHRPGGVWDHTHKVSESIQVTTSRDILAAMARGEGPSDAFIALGYAGWESGSWRRKCATTPGSPCPWMRAWCSICPSRIAGWAPGNSSASMSSG